MKKIFVKIHLWLSLPFGIIIAIVCLTGAILVFEDEMLELCYPSHYFVEEVKEEPLSISELMALGRKQLPDSIKINGIRVSPDPKRTYQLVIPGKKAAAFINPYTGEVTGIDNGQGFFMQTMRLHRWLLTEFKRDGGYPWGRALVGYATIVMVFIIISGLVIWYPKNRKNLTKRLKIKTTAGWRRFFYDLHVTGGFYAALLLLVLALTGLTWSFNWYRDAFYTVFGVSTQPQAHGHAPAKGKSEKKEKPQKEIDYIQWDVALKNLKDKNATFNWVTIQDGTATVSSANYGNTRGSDRYTFDASTGDITSAQLYQELPKSGKIRGWIYSVHVGSWGGLVTRILTCLVSFLGAILVITGYYFWIKKTFKKRKKRKSKEK